VEGFITSISATTFVVNGQTVDFSGALFRAGVRDDLTVGTKVEAEGFISGGILVAEKVTFKAAIKIEGNIATVSTGTAETFTIEGLPGITVAVDDNLTELRPLNDDPANVPAAGDNVRIRARESGNLLLAQRFEVVSDQPDNRLILQGLVESFNATGGGSVTILGITVDCTQISNANFKLEEVSIGRAAFFADLQVGDMVKARASERRHAALGGNRSAGRRQQLIDLEADGQQEKRRRGGVGSAVSPGGFTMMKLVQKAYLHGRAGQA
jgi:hypothetical protein